MLRLTRLGKKHEPVYRIIAVDKRKKRDGKYIEKVGFYNPLQDKFEVDSAKFAAWTAKGAQVSEGLGKLLKKYPLKTSKGV